MLKRSTFLIIVSLLFANIALNAKETSLKQCKNGDIKLLSVNEDAAMSKRSVKIVMQNSSNKSCSLSGWVDVTLKKGVEVKHKLSSYFVPTQNINPFVLAPKEEMWFSISWTSCGVCTSCDSLQKILIGMPQDEAFFNTKSLQNLQICSDKKIGGVTLTPMVKK
jgi:hypothetical protein